MIHSLMLLDGLKLCVFKTFYGNVYFVVFHVHGMHLWQCNNLNVRYFLCVIKFHSEIACSSESKLQPVMFVFQVLDILLVLFHTGEAR